MAGSVSVNAELHDGPTHGIGKHDAKVLEGHIPKYETIEVVNAEDRRRKFGLLLNDDKHKFCIQGVEMLTLPQLEPYNPAKWKISCQKRANTKDFVGTNMQPAIFLLSLKIVCLPFPTYSYDTYLKITILK